MRDLNASFSKLIWSQNKTKEFMCQCQESKMFYYLIGPRKDTQYLIRSGGNNYVASQGV